MVETLAGLADRTIQPKPQDHALATLAPILTRDDGRMNFAAHTAEELRNRWRGFHPWPGAFAMLEGKKLIVHRMELASRAAAEPGQLFVDQGRLLVACAQDTWLDLVELQLEGKRRISAAEFLHGTHLPSDARLG
jgi:methionyl-tRNA formyltransferase